MRITRPFMPEIPLVEFTPSDFVVDVGLKRIPDITGKYGTDTRVEVTVSFADGAFTLKDYLSAHNVFGECFYYFNLSIRESEQGYDSTVSNICLNDLGKAFRAESFGYRRKRKAETKKAAEEDARKAALEYAACLEPTKIALDQATLINNKLRNAHDLMLRQWLNTFTNPTCWTWDGTESKTLPELTKEATRLRDELAQVKDKIAAEQTRIMVGELEKHGCSPEFVKRFKKEREEYSPPSFPRRR